MKKLISLALALVMILSLSTVAFADASVDSYSASTATTVNLYKAYTVTGGSTLPNEDLTFSVATTTGKTNPDGTMISIESTLNVSTASKNSDGKWDIAVAVPSYSVPGEYFYTITEVAGNAEGATYLNGTSAQTINVSVLVTMNHEKKQLEAQFLLKDGTAEDKNDTFTNTYDLGSLSVNKTVAGSAASRDQYFKIDVTFMSSNPVKSDISYTGGKYNGQTAGTIAGSQLAQKDGQGAYTWTETIELKHDDTVTFTNIPAGVLYTVVEKDEHKLAEDATPDVAATDKDYIVSGEQRTSATILSDQTKEVEIVNTKNPTINQGVVLDSMPYILLLTLAAAGMFVLLTKKRAKEY